jgi:hypothetical protein
MVRSIMRGRAVAMGEKVRLLRFRVEINSHKLRF